MQAGADYMCHFAVPWSLDPVELINCVLCLKIDPLYGKYILRESCGVVAKEN